MKCCMFQGLWPEHFNKKFFNLRDENGFDRTVVLSVTEIDLNSLIKEKTQQQKPTDATHVMVHKMDNSTSLHTVYIKALHLPQGLKVAEVINSVAGGATLIRLDEPDNTFYRVKCAIFN